MMGLRGKLARKTKLWATSQADHIIFQKPKSYFTIKLVLLAGIALQRILIITDEKFREQFTFDLVQLIGLPFLFIFECLLFSWVKRTKRLKNITDLLFGGFQIVILEFIISLSIPFLMETHNNLVFILQQEILFICLHTNMFFNSFFIKSGLLLYICITFIFRLAPPLLDYLYTGWSMMALAIIASFFVVLFSKQKPEVSQSAKPAEDFSKLETIPHGLAILTRDKEVIFMNGVFKGILNLSDERDALQKILKMKRFESYPEETKQLLLKEIKVRMNSDVKSKVLDEEKLDINNFPTAMSLSKRRMTTDTPAIYIKKPYSPQNSQPTVTLGNHPEGTDSSKFLQKNADLEQGKSPLVTKLSHLASIQANIETDKDDQNTVEFSINSVISSLIDESPDRVRRKISLAQVTKNIVNGLFIRRASQHFKNNKTAANDIFDLTNTKTQKVQAVNRNAKGELRILEITLTPMTSGQKEALFIYLNDITSEMKAKELHETSQYKDRLLKFVSHEFRTPLNCLVISLNTLKPLVSKELYMNYLAPALNSTLMLLSLVNDILDYSQMQAKKLKIVIAPSNLRNILSEVVSMMEMQAQARNLKLRLDWDPRISRTFFTDGNRLKQIIVNLVSNALKFTIDGSITIRSTYITKSICKIEVVDTGVGISKENLQNLFKEFGKIQENMHMNPQGVGLGLVISKLLSQELGSDRVGLQVKSEVGMGTTFYFFLESKRKEETGFENTDLGSSSDDQEPQVYAPKLSEPHSRKLILQKKTGSFKKERPQYSKAKTSNTRKNAVPKKLLADTPQPYTLNFKHVYSKNSIQSMTPIVAPQEQGEYNFKSRKQDVQRRQRCLSTGFSNDPQEGKNHSEQVTKIFKKLNRTCKCPKVLIVDDNAFNLTALKMLLKSFGIESVGVIDGEAAIDQVLENEGHSHFCRNFAMIFMDVEMPKLNGFETSKELRRLMGNKEVTYTPIVGITGHNPKDKRVECMLSGMNDLVCKPVTAQIMQEILCRWIIPE